MVILKGQILLQQVFTIFGNYFSGQASSSTAGGAGIIAQGFADIGWQIAENSRLRPNQVSSENLTGTGVYRSHCHLLALFHNALIQVTEVSDMVYLCAL